MSALSKEIDDALTDIVMAARHSTAHVTRTMVEKARAAIRAAILADREAAVEAARKEEREACGREVSIRAITLADMAKQEPPDVANAFSSTVRVLLNTADAIRARGAK